MSSMRNAAPRRPHRERAQLQSRSKWGLLEKHKDYSLRAADYNLKKRKLTRLREKAKDRNPDEFAFGMVSQRRDAKTGTKDGERLKALSVDAVKLLKTQDAGYLGLVEAKTRRERERAETEIKAERGWSDGAKKVVFVGDTEEQKGTARALENGRSEEWVDESGDEDIEEEEQVSGSKLQAQKSRKQLEAEKEKVREDRAARKRRKRVAGARRVKLEVLQKREKSIKDAMRELELQRAKMTNSIGGVNKNGVKWKIRERKK